MISETVRSKNNNSIVAIFLLQHFIQPYIEKLTPNDYTSVSKLTRGLMKYAFTEEEELNCTLSGTTTKPGIKVRRLDINKVNDIVGKFDFKT